MKRKQRKFNSISRLVTVMIVIIGSYIVWWYNKAEQWDKVDQIIFTTQSDWEYNCSAVSDITENECIALVDLYNNTNWENWINNSRWLKTKNPCTWRWVLCEEGHVVTLNLSKNNLEWTIPESISGLTKLFALFLWDNNLEWTIPKSISSLAKLKHIEFGKNDISWSMPSELGNLWEKTTNIAIFLNENSLCGLIPESFQDNEKIDVLNVDRNHLTVVKGEYDEEMREWINKIVDQWNQSPELCWNNN